MPLTLSRFRSHVGADSSVAAMREAASEVLKRYTHTYGSGSPRISALRLCSVCGVELRGLPRRREVTRAVYSFYRAYDALDRHSGELYLNASPPSIVVPPDTHPIKARVAVGHELGHFLIHWRGSALDPVTSRMSSSAEEEALSEYGARLLLLPNTGSGAPAQDENVAAGCLRQARSAEVTVHAAAARVGDPDVPLSSSVKALILWKLNPRTGVSEPVAKRLTPQWHLCPSAFIPVKRCHAGRQSLIAELAANGDATIDGSRIEDVSIGSLVGRFRIDAVAWGSLKRGTRLVLSAFLIP